MVFARWTCRTSNIILAKKLHTARSLTESIPELPVLDYSAGVDWSALHRSQQPALIRGLAKQWPAVSDASKKWSDLAALKERIAEDVVVPVEIGNSYMDPDTRTAHVDLRSLLDYLQIDPETSPDASAVPRVYWAQHELSEVAAMFADVVVPEMCGSTGRGSLYRTNIWFGGVQGTVSPCHFDPYENLLCQVVGSKEVTLFAPEFGQRYLYPAVGTVQANTALVDVAEPDLEAHPLYADGLRAAAAADTAVQQRGGLALGRGVLHPGDAVYIPQRWWHHCQTRFLSCSVNFWWV